MQKESSELAGDKARGSAAFCHEPNTEQTDPGLEPELPSPVPLPVLNASRTQTTPAYTHTHVHTPKETVTRTPAETFRGVEACTGGTCCGNPHAVQVGCHGISWGVWVFPGSVKGCARQLGLLEKARAASSPLPVAPQAALGTQVYCRELMWW